MTLMMGRRFTAGLLCVLVVLAGWMFTSRDTSAQQR